MPTDVIMIAGYFRYKDGVMPNVLALGVVLLGYPIGVALLMVPSWFAYVIGFPLVVLTLTWSAYFIHEFAHHAIFKSAKANTRWGTLMSWINGSCYARFEDLRRKHMRHHVERADVITFDVQGFLRAHPVLLKLVLALEWLYIPAVELLMHVVVMVLPFRRGAPAAKRWRMIAIVTVRVTAFAVFAWYAPFGWLLYCVAYLVFITILRFADCFQHTYDAYPIADDTPIPSDKIRDRAYEQCNTYSNVVGIESRILNMLWLNFGFHNAHHERPAMPWHQLPAFHRKQLGDRCPQVIPVRELLLSFHRHRVRRVMAQDYGEVLSPGQQGRADGFLGAVGVSFLTAV
ncbi:fatty acid desaturase [uncultured Oxalicibacterium sp.]|uniref:fatty acid desaturase family protein n=1 Tax=uncultured Oxalicibacterium sp. TaxID=1168540 RepID=UPI0025E35AAA|nr:fatty acid desaturase [uncultured Oxalicibacterium sp.]